MKTHRRWALTVAVISSLALPSISQATNGYFLIGYGSNSRAMGGVGVALGQDGLAAAANPAAMADVDVSTMRVDIAGELFIPRRAAAHNSSLLPADSVSGANLFLIPAMGGLFKFDRKLTVGMAVIGAGLGTRYDQSCDNRPAGSDGNFFNYNCANLSENLAGDTLGVSLMQMQMLPSAAYKINDTHTVGASLAIAVQTFRAYGLGAFAELGFSAGQDKVTNEGNDWAYGGGIRLGWLGKFFDEKLSLGANYSSRVYMTKFEKYENLFARQGEFDIPENFAIGMAYHPNDQWTLAFDVQHIRFSSIDSVGNLGPVPSGGSAAFFPEYCQPDTNVCTTGNNLGLGFGWDDVTAYKLGVRYKHNSKWTFRAGLNYGETPIQSDQILFNLLAPAVVEKHATLGVTYSPTQNIEWSFNYMHAFKETLTGKTNFWPNGVNSFDELTVDNAAASMYQHSFGVTFGYKL